MTKINYTVVEPEDDVPDDRKQTLGDIKIERRDPHGFWWIINPQSKFMAGAFTSVDEVQKAVHRHNQALDAAVNKQIAEDEAKKADEAFKTLVKNRAIVAAQVKKETPV